MRIYPKSWTEISLAVKQAAGWKCSECGRQCYQQGNFPPSWTTSQRKAYTLQIHHWNRKPSENRPENLVVLCTGCHLSYHRESRGNISPGQLELNLPTTQSALSSIFPQR